MGRGQSFEAADGHLTCDINDSTTAQTFDRSKTYTDDQYRQKSDGEKKEYQLGDAFGTFRNRTSKSEYTQSREMFGFGRS